VENPSNLPPVFRPRDLVEHGYSVRYLQTLLRHDRAERVGRGLYRLKQRESSEHETIAMVCRRAPNAVVCLLTALHMHGIGTQAPREVWIAIDRKARRPRFTRFSVRIVRFSGQMLSYAVDSMSAMGVTIRVTSSVRTVVDCFRYRRKIGSAVAIEALRDLLRSGKATPGDVLRVADACRVRSVIVPYVEALTA